MSDEAVEQTLDAVVSVDNLLKVYGIPRGSLNKLIKNREFPTPLRALGEKRKYYLASQVQAWLDSVKYTKKRRGYKRVKKVQEQPPMEALTQETLTKDEKLSLFGKLGKYICGL